MPATALVLAGGLGTRLASAVPDRPKVLAAVAGRPFLAWLLERLAGFGVREAVLCTGHRAEQVEEAFGDAFAGLRLVHSAEREPLGTGGALRLALGRLGAATHTVLALNGDSVCDVDLDALGTWHATCDARATIALAEVADAGRYGRVEVAADGGVRGFHEKAAGGPGPAWVNAGVYVLSRPLLAAIPAGRAVSLERDLLPAWVGRGLYGFRSPATFLDIGTPASYADAAVTLGMLDRRPSGAPPPVRGA